MNDNRPPPPTTCRNIPGDGFTMKVEFMRNIYLVFHSKSEIAASLQSYDVSFVPGLGVKYFSFHATQEDHEIILNKSLSHLKDG